MTVNAVSLAPQATTYVGGAAQTGWNLGKFRKPRWPTWFNIGASLQFTNGDYNDDGVVNAADYTTLWAGLFQQLSPFLTHRGAKATGNLF